MCTKLNVHILAQILYNLTVKNQEDGGYLSEMMNSKQLIEIALLAGEIMLTNGAETHRVEDTMVRICSRGKLKLAESFVIPTVIVATVADENNNLVTVSKRIKSRTIDLNKISLVNQFSRDFQVKDFTYEQAIEILNKIKYKKGYDSYLLPFAAALVCCFSTILFGGKLKDAISAFFVGFVTQTILNFMNSKNFSYFISYIIGGAITASIAIITVNINIGVHLDKIIIGSVMIMTPGVAITNAIRDTIAGDLLSGVARGVEAFLIAVFIATGAGIALSLFR